MTSHCIGPPTTLADNEQTFGLTPYCRRCNHRDDTVTPRELAERYNVPTSTAVIDLQRRLVCTACGKRTAYFPGCDRDGCQ